MDVVNSLKALAASTMTPQHHSGSPIPQFFQIWTLTPQVLQYKGNTHAHSQHIKVLKHFVYIQYGCGIQSEASYSLKYDATTSFMFAHTPIFQNLAPTPHRYYSVRVKPYTHSQHIKVLKHIIFIQYGCGMQSEASCSLNHDTPASFRFAHTLIFQNLAPTPLTGIIV